MVRMIGLWILAGLMGLMGTGCVDASVETPHRYDVVVYGGTSEIGRAHV